MRAWLLATDADQDGALSFRARTLTLTLTLTNPNQP